MGTLLSTPITEKDSFYHELNGLIVGASSMQGFRPEMEDQHSVAAMPSSDTTLLAVFDGHGGSEASRICAQKLLEHVTMQQGDKAHTADDLRATLHRAFLSIDAHLKDLADSGMFNQSGTTAICGLITTTDVVVASVGDSRGILATASHKVVPLSEDHKPNNTQERRRIESAGGFVVFGRVEGSLAMSRALGDFFYKSTPDLGPDEQKVIAVPDLVDIPRTDEDEFLLLACDGIWDVMSNYEVAKFVRECLQLGERDPRVIAEDLMDQCLELGSKDNMTVVLALFQGAQYGDGPGISERRKQRAQKRSDSQKQPQPQQQEETEQEESNKCNDALEEYN